MTNGMGTAFLLEQRGLFDPRTTGSLFSDVRLVQCLEVLALLRKVTLKKLLEIGEG